MYSDGSPSDKNMFTLGACFRLALVIHDLTGWPIYAFEWDGYSAVHAFVQTPKGTFLDVLGEHTAKEMRARWGYDTIMRYPPEAFDDWEDCEYDEFEAVNRAHEIAPGLIRSVIPGWVQPEWTAYV